MQWLWYTFSSVILLHLRSRFFPNKAAYDTEKMSLKGPCILAWFWVKFPEHLCPYVQLSLRKSRDGKARDATYHGQHTMQSIFYIQDEMYNKPHWWQGLLTTFTVPGIDRILF